MIERRGFIGAAAAAAAIGKYGVSSSVASSVVQSQPSFDLIRQVDAGVLSVGYAEVGPQGGPPVILLHGWPYDIHSYVDAAPLLGSLGYHVIVPYLRGYGTTRFLSNDAFRNGEQVVFAIDAIALMDALGIERAIVGGYDWGARTAVIMAALWPHRCKGLVSVSGYLIVNLQANQRPLPPRAELGWWYQYYFATERGRAGYEQNVRDFNRLIWTLASPAWHFDEQTYERSAQAFANPDHTSIVIHNYRWRLELAHGDPQLLHLENKLQRSPLITVPAITIGSDFDGASADGSTYRRQFSGPYEHRILKGIGHNVPQEAPQAFADAVNAVQRL